MAREPVSAVIITMNEAATIERCVRALSWCDEIIVVDSGSTDATVETCRRLGCRVEHHPFAGFGAQKRHAVSLASHRWVLNIDADEVVSVALAEEIRAVLADPTDAGYRLPRRFHFLGRRFGRGRGSCDHPIRLFRRDMAGYSDDAVHESVKVNGTIGTITHEMEHHSYVSLSQYVQKFDRYTSLAAQDLQRRGIHRSIVATFLTIPLYFLKHYVVSGHWMNGIHGLVWSVFSSWYPFVKVAKSRLERPSDA